MRRQPGVVTAVVRTLDDPEQEGRVGIEYRWLPGGESLPTVFAPVAAALSGGGRGAYFMPEEEDEVLVAFDRGDWDHPYIVGFLWNGADQPPETDHRNRVIVTPGGHTLRFEDGDAKRVVLRTDGGHEVVMDDDGGALAVRSADGHEATFDDGGRSVTVRVAGGASLTLRPESAELSGGGRRVLLSGGQVQIS